MDESVPVTLVPVDPIDFRPQPDVAEDDPVWRHSDEAAVQLEGCERQKPALT